jgi:predicted DNA-binding transcriptional regulator AlpA
MENLQIDNPFTVIVKKLTNIENQLSELRGQPTHEIVDLDGAVEITGMSKSDLYKKTSKKLLKHFKAGKKLIFKRSDLIDFMLAHPQQPATGIRVEK